jgi:glycosyltransferase involved in cell wall biosynthesis
MHLSGYTCNTNTLIRDGHLCSGRIDLFDCTVCSFKTLFGMPGIAAVPAAMAGILSVGAGLTRKMPPGKITTMLSMPATVRRIKSELAELADNADQLIALTEWYKKILVENGVPPAKITVIPQRLMTARVPLDRKTFPPALPIKVVFVGRLQPQKGVHLLIEAAKSFPGEKLTVDIYGIEEDTVYYRECRAAVDGTPNIRLMGPLNRDKVVAKLTEYDILCLPSTFSEMSPLVIQEAFAAGIPVLASRVMGNAEQITPGKNGLLFAFKSADDLRTQLNRLITEPALINQMKNQITPPGNFSEIATQYMELIKNFRPA